MFKYHCKNVLFAFHFDDVFGFDNCVLKYELFKKILCSLNKNEFEV